MRKGLAAALAAGAALSALPPLAGAYRTGPPAAHTGGFGEPTCAECHHQDAAAGEAVGGADARPAGALTIVAPERYRPGATYDIRVTLADPHAAAAGVQLAARFADGAAAGDQAGTLAALDSTMRVVTGGDVAYASHTAAGATLARPGHASWVVRWTAPAGGGLVVFHAAANAANDDDSEFGDRIHVAEIRAASSGG